MKKVLSFIVASIIIVSSFGISLSDAKWWPNAWCVTIQDQVLLDSNWDIIPMWYIKDGSRAWYNYQAHQFNWDWYGDNLVMKWNEAWLSNKDCWTQDQLTQGEITEWEDGFLDRHYGFDSYKDSWAWLTNHMSWEYLDLEGDIQKWTYFIKIVAVPSDAILDTWVWYTVEWDEIWLNIWWQFAIIQELYNDTWTWEHWIVYKSPVWPGFGKY